MKVHFLGCKSPSTSKTNGKTYYSGYIAQPLNHGGFGYKPQEFETDEHVYAKFGGVEPFGLIDIDAQIEINTFNGNQRARLIITEMQPL